MTRSPQTIRSPDTPGGFTDPFSVEQAAVDRTGPSLQLGQVVQATQAAQVGGVVDDGLDAHRAAVLEVLLDPGVAVAGVDGDLGAVGDDVGVEGAGGLAALGLAAFEDQLHDLGPS